MYYHRRRSHRANGRRHGRRHVRPYRPFPWPFFLIAFIVISGGPFSFWILLLIGLTFIQFISRQTRKSGQRYDPPQYLGSAGPSESGAVQVPVQYYEEPVKTTSASKAFCFECGGKMETGQFCRFCGTDQRKF